MSLLSSGGRQGWSLSSTDLSAITQRGPNRPLVVVADDHRSVATAITSCLGGRFTVLAPITALPLLERASSVLHHWVLVCGLDFEGRPAFDFWRRLAQRVPCCRIIAYSAHDGDVSRELASSAGVWRFVSKRDSLELLSKTVADASADLLSHQGGGPPEPLCRHEVGPGGLKGHVHGDLVTWALSSGFRRIAIARVAGVAPQTVAYHASKRRTNVPQLPSNGTNQG